MKLFEKIILTLIPLAFFLIAVSEGKLYWLGGVMTVLVIYYYIRKYLVK